MNVAEAQAELQAAQAAHAGAKQVFFDAPTDANAGKVSKTELLIERAQRQLERATADAAEAKRAQQLETFSRLQAERAAGDERCAEISAELVELERRARALLFELVDVVSAQQSGHFIAKPLSLALDQPTPLRPPADLATRRHALQDELWRAHHADGIDAHEFRHVVSEWLQRPARGPGALLGDRASTTNARPAS